VLQHNDSRNSRDQESAECSTPPIPQKAEDCRDTEADQDRDPHHVSILPADELVFLQVGYVVVWLIGLQFKKQPSDMGVKKAFRNAVRVIVMIHMFVMAPMFARPHQDRIFKGGRAKNEDEEFDRKPGAKREMRK
jgi:hypothetical protein